MHSIRFSLDSRKNLNISESSIIISHEQVESANESLNISLKRLDAGKEWTPMFRQHVAASSVKQSKNSNELSIRYCAIQQLHFHFSTSCFDAFLAFHIKHLKSVESKVFRRNLWT